MMFYTKLLTNNLLIKSILFFTMVFCLTLLGCSSDTDETTTGSDTFAIPASCCPSWSPDSNRVTYVSDRDGNLEIYVSNIDGSNPVNISNNPADDGWAIWSPASDKIAFLSTRDGKTDVYVANSDGSNTLNLTNTPGHNESAVSWSPDGTTLAYISWSVKSTPNPYTIGDEQLMTIGVDGSNNVELIAAMGTDLDIAPEWSHDGTRIAFTSDKDTDVSRNLDIYIINKDGTGLRRFTTQDAQDYYPTWSPDDSQMVFISRRWGGDDILIKPIVSTGNVGAKFSGRVSDEILMTINPNDDWQPIWTKDGKRILFVTQRHGHAPEIYIMDAINATTYDCESNMDNTIQRGCLASGVKTPIDLHLDASDGHISISPDGTHLAFVSDRSGFNDVFVMPISAIQEFQEGGFTSKVEGVVNVTAGSNSSNGYPYWSDGKERNRVPKVKVGW